MERAQHGQQKLGSVSYGESLTGVSSDGGNNVAMDRNFYEVEYNGRQGWVGASYVVRNTLEIVLMESNVPAYIAPDARSKKVGSLSKMTRYRVIGFYDDYYIVSFRGAACAYIPKRCRALRYEIHRPVPTGGCAQRQCGIRHEAPHRPG
ncbi:MAG: SH3 domain-containing protein [Christensenellales bacterium]